MQRTKIVEEPATGVWALGVGSNAQRRNRACYIALAILLFDRHQGQEAWDQVVPSSLRSLQIAAKQQTIGPITVRSSWPFIHVTLLDRRPSNPTSAGPVGATRPANDGLRPNETTPTCPTPGWI